MKTELQKCLEGEYFQGRGGDLYDITLQSKRLQAQLRTVDYADETGKRQIYEQLFGSIGKNVAIDTDFRCEYGKNIHIGNHVIINMNCTFVDNNLITIGNKVLIASNVQIYTATHPVDITERLVEEWDETSGEAFFRTYALPVTIEDQVWIGGGVVILPGVTIGQNSVVGAGSVVTRSMPPNSVAVGNPCRVIREIKR